MMERNHLQEKSSSVCHIFVFSFCIVNNDRLTGKFYFNFSKNKTNVQPQAKKFNKEKGFKVVQDVRNKIIQKNRAKIRDARDKLAQIAKQSGDARLKLIKKKKEFKKANNYVKPSTARQQNTYKKAYLTTANLNRYTKPSALTVDEVPSFRRTVQNDFLYKPDPRLASRPYDIAPPLARRIPTRSLQSDWESDPFGCYEVPVSRPHDVSEPKPINRTLYQDSYSRLHRKVSTIPAYDDMEEIPIRNSGLYDRDRIVMEDKASSKINLRSQYLPSKSHASESYTNAIKPASKPGYRIVVSNLRGSVSQNDIKVRRQIYAFILLQILLSATEVETVARYSASEKLKNLFLWVMFEESIVLIPVINLNCIFFDMK